MHNIFLVVKYEIKTTLQKRSFWLLTFVFPAIILFLSVGIQALGSEAIEEAEENASSAEYQASLGTGVGYVDQAGLIKEIPVWIPDDLFTHYLDAKIAQEDLENGLIRQYYLIPEDFIETGEYFLIDREYQPMRSSNNAEVFEEVISRNLIELDELGLFLDDPTPNTQFHQIRPSTKPDESDPLTFIVPFATLFIFFFTITSSSGFMLTSVTREKESRTAEILLVSLEPRQLMLGKVIGLGLVALLQMSIWMGGALFGLDRSAEFSEITSSFSLPPGFVIWGVLFFLFGYFLYASLLGAIGALAPNAREGGQFTFIILLPLMIPLWFNVAFIENPGGPVATFLSIFPLTSVSMMTRMTATSVPIWQILLSLAGLGLTTYLIVLLAARFFQAENLLSTDSVSLKRMVGVFRNKSEKS